MYNDLTVILYTSNYLDDKNPYFIENTRKQLLLATNGLPIISVSQTPTTIGHNICLGNIGRSHLNIYKQILIGAKAAKTKFVAMAEDDILYSPQHFRLSDYIKKEYLERADHFIYDMNKLSIFTWSKPPIFSFRPHRMVVNHLIAPRKMLIDALEERFNRIPFLKSVGWDERKICKYWGDPGRYEELLGVTPRPTRQEYSWSPSMVFSHEYAYGYENNQGKRKKLGNLLISEVPAWGRAEQVLKLWKR